ncbi:hypothetical protein GWN63_02940 [Candidatus Bathyarchaeota archaeon]|nr:hypothetical protein [Candidatus Bathyarchaeota archaeon]NIU81186.1 hypothetical protein [Candidatus Bathyarchaeota archaeon]NIV67825.1 hypothetical protein [Candidatus Bathyarchaeota archaeon]NIW16614.1 hypothetical protein [Candidatus Bathyarchaeota archaeon]NIW34426.1 hypothetical protein [Candidatus Bathyarchaeota archaeon]
MSWKPKLKVENFMVLAFSIFYTIAGVAHAFILVISNFEFYPVAVLAILSLVTAYGLLKMRRWTVLLATVLFFLGAAFSIPVLYSSISIHSFSASLEVLLLNLALILYLVLSLFGFVYVAAKREEFE